eukprot:3654041-Rhodomonas_salina.1
MEDKTNNAILSRDVRCSQLDRPDLLRDSDWGATDQGSIKVGRSLGSPTYGPYWALPPMGMRPRL